MGFRQVVFFIPRDKIDQLIKYKDLLTKKQKEQIVSAIHTGGQLVVKPTKTQSGGFLGTLLASIGVPLLLNALTGKGLQVDKDRPRRSINVYVPKMHRMPEIHMPIQKIKKQTTAGGLVLPMYPPPFYGTWDNQIGMGVKPKKKATKKKTKTLKKKGRRSATRKKQSIQQHPNTRSNSVKFVNKPLSNFDLLN